MNMRDRNGNIIELGSKIKDEQGEYTVALGDFEKDDNSEWIAEGNIRKLLWPERAKKFELVEA